MMKTAQVLALDARVSHPMRDRSNARRPAAHRIGSYAKPGNILPPRPTRRMSVGLQRNRQQPTVFDCCQIAFDGIGHRTDLAAMGVRSCPQTDPQWMLTISRRSSSPTRSDGFLV